MLTVEQNQRLTQTGADTPTGKWLRRYWWPVGSVTELEKEPVQPVRLMGEDLTLFKDERGRYGLLGDRCAHRAISLPYGIPQTNGLRCCYHGWTYDTEGHVIDMPFEPACLPLKIKAYPTEVLGGLIWAYLGPEPRPLLPRWEGMVRDDLKREIGMAVIPCNWLQSIENSGDSPHVVYAHCALSGYVLEKLGRPDLRRHEYSSGMNGFQPKRTPVRNPYGWGSVMFPYTGALHDLYEIRVPVDDTHTQYIVYNLYYPEHEAEFG